MSKAEKQARMTEIAEARGRITLEFARDPVVGSEAIMIIARPAATALSFIAPDLWKSDSEDWMGELISHMESFLDQQLAKRP